MANKPRGNPSKVVPHQFKPGESGNPNGRPKKLISSINDELKKEGYTAANASDVKDAFLTLVNLPMAKLDALATNAEAPMLYRIAAKELLSGKGAEYLEKLLDRTQGKPTQNTKHEVDLPVETEITLIVKGSKSNLLDKPI